MLSLIEDFCSFVKTSPTSWHAVKQAGYRLALKDFHPLEEETPWNLQEEKNTSYQEEDLLQLFVCQKNLLRKFFLWQRIQIVLL